MAVLEARDSQWKNGRARKCWFRNFSSPGSLFRSPAQLQVAGETSLLSHPHFFQLRPLSHSRVLSVCSCIHTFLTWQLFTGFCWYGKGYEAFSDFGCSKAPSICPAGPATKAERPDRKAWHKNLNDWEVALKDLCNQWSLMIKNQSRILTLIGAYVLSWGSVAEVPLTNIMQLHSCLKLPFTVQTIGDNNQSSRSVQSAEQTW